MSFAQLQMMPALGLSQADFGFAAGIFFCSYAMMQVPSNMLLARIGARTVLSSCLVLWGSISAATGLIHDAISLSVLRILLGLAQSGYYSGCLLYLRTWFPARDSAHAIAIFVTSGAAGTITCSLTSGVIMSACDGLLGMGGWRWLFLSQGAPAIVLGALLPLCLSDRPAHASWLTKEELEQLHAALAYEDLEAEDSAPLLGVQTTVGVALRRLSTWLFMAQYYALNTVTYTVMFFLPVQLTQIFPSLAPWEVGLLNALPAALKILLGPPVAKLADAHDDRRFALTWGLFAVCGSHVLLASAAMRYGPSRAVPLLLLIATLCEGCAVAVFWSVHHRRQPRQLAATSIAAVNSFGNLGGFAGTYVLGFLHDVVNPPDGSSLPAVRDWAFGTCVIGAAFLAVTLTTATWLQEGDSPTRGRAAERCVPLLGHATRASSIRVTER